MHGDDARLAPAKSVPRTEVPTPTLEPALTDDVCASRSAGRVERAAQADHQRAGARGETASAALTVRADSANHMM